MRSSLFHRNFLVLWLLDHDHRHRVSIPAPSHLLIIDPSVGTDTHPSQMLYPRILTAYHLGYQLPSNPVSVQDLSIAIDASLLALWRLFDDGTPPTQGGPQKSASTSTRSPASGPTYPREDPWLVSFGFGVDNRDQ